MQCKIEFVVLIIRFTIANEIMSDGTLQYNHYLGIKQPAGYIILGTYIICISHIIRVIAICYKNEE